MKKLIVLLFLSAIFCTSIHAQSKDEEFGTIGHVTLSNGTTISSSFNQQTNILSVEVENNDDEVEVIVVDDGTVISSESTVFEEDELQVAIPMSSQPLDIYVRTKEDTQYVGSINNRK